MFLQKAEAITLSILVIDADEDNSLCTCTLPCCLQERGFFCTGCTRRSPEIDDQGLAFQTRQVKRWFNMGTECGQREIWGRLAYQWVIGVGGCIADAARVQTWSRRGELRPE